MFDKLEPDKFDSLQALIESITPEIHENLKTAVEIGRWANGDRLTPEQIENSLQAIIFSLAWLYIHLQKFLVRIFLHLNKIRH